MNANCEFPASHATSEEIGRILAESRTIAVVGLSPRPERDSYRVSRYMQSQGYRIIPVNPNYAEVLGERCYPELSAVGEPVDVVNIFRRPEAVPDVVDAAIAAQAKTIWMQEGIVHNAAAEKARRAGLTVVMNRCLLKEHRWRKG